MKFWGEMLLGMFLKEGEVRSRAYQCLERGWTAGWEIDVDVSSTCAKFLLTLNCRKRELI